MGPREVEANGFVIGVKPVRSKSITGSFTDIERFPSSLDFVRFFPMNLELAFHSINSILENLFYFPSFWSSGIEVDWFFGARFRETWGSYEVWSVVDWKMAVINPSVDALQARREVEFVVIVSIWFFGKWKRS